MTGARSPEKRAAFESFMTRGTVCLHFDARRPGVLVPGRYARQAHVILEYGHDMPTPMRDFEVSGAGIRATLLFGWWQRRTFVPWTAVFFVADATGRGASFPEDWPPELVSPAPVQAEAPPPVPEHPDGDELVAGQLEARPLALFFEAATADDQIAELLIAIERVCGEKLEPLRVAGAGDLLEVQLVPAAGLGRDRWRERCERLGRLVGPGPAPAGFAQTRRALAARSGRAQALNAALERRRSPQDAPAAADAAGGATLQAAFDRAGLVARAITLESDITILLSRPGASPPPLP